jgi:predicted house-cleaning NTP pyrophosphatase (Maf/HAM1 superfamily)
MTTNTDKADNMRRFFVSFDLVSTFTDDLLTCFAGEVEAKTAELAVIAAHQKVMTEQRLFGKPVNVQTFEQVTA